MAQKVGRKLGEGALLASWHQGVADAHAFIWGGAVHHGDYGPGPGSTVNRDDGRTADTGKDSVLDSRLKEAEASRDDRGREDKGMDRDP